MKRIAASIFVFLATIAPAVAADTTERNESIPDANPECMQVNGPDCILRSDVVPPRTAAPPGTIAPSGVVVIPAPTPPGTVAPQGVVGVPASAPPITIAPSAPNIIAPAAPAQPSAIISPRR